MGADAGHQPPFRRDPACLSSTTLRPLCGSNRPIPNVPIQFPDSLLHGDRPGPRCDGPDSCVQVCSDQLQNAFVLHFPRYPGRQDAMIHPVKEISPGPCPPPSSIFPGYTPGPVAPRHGFAFPDETQNLSWKTQRRNSVSAPAAGLAGSDGP